MTDTYFFAQLQPFALAGGGAVAGATSITLKSMTGIDGNALTMAGTFGSIGFGTIEPGNGANEEQISFTGLTNNSNGTVTLTGISSVTFLAPYTATSGLAKTHAGSTSFVISNTSGFYDKLVAKNNDEVITGQYIFPGGGTPNAPLSDTVYTPPTNDLEYASKKYVDTVAVSGAPDANTTTKGIVQIATQAQVDAKTAVGSTGASLVPTPALARSTLLSDYVPDTGAANAYAIAPSPTVSALIAGQRFSFKVANSNTTASTLVVNALTGTAIFKQDGATSLVSGDLIAGQVVEVEYNGKNGFQLMTPIATAPLSAASVKFGGTGADGALSISSGTTTLSIASAYYLEKNYTSISITGTAALAFSNPNSPQGSTVSLRSQGNVTITSSANPVIDLRNLGGTAGSGSGGTNNVSEQTSNGGNGFLGPVQRMAFNVGVNAGIGGNGGASMTNDGGAGSTYGAGVTGTARQPFLAKSIPTLFTPWSRQLFPGGGGAGGFGGNNNGFTGGNGGNGGQGAGSLDIECNGAYNFTTGTINASGTAGSAGTAGTGTAGGGGGGGGAGCIRILYTTLTADSGTYTVTGGAGGSGGSPNGTAGGAGGDGTSIRQANNYWF